MELNNTTNVELYEDIYSSKNLLTTKDIFTIEPMFIFSNDQRDELEECLRVKNNPYTHYGNFLDEVKNIAAEKIPSFLSEAVSQMCEFNLKEKPVLYMKNCPIGNIPELDYNDPLQSKYERKTDFVAEAFNSVFSQLHRTAIVSYISANNGDMFHDITPMKRLENTITQRSLNTLHFHFDLPDNNVRPDWVYLLSLRNSTMNTVFTPIVRLQDVIDNLDQHTIEVLHRPLYAQPKARQTGNILEYGVQENGYNNLSPLLVTKDGETVLRYFEGCHTSEDEEGSQAISELREILHKLKFNLFLEERDFIAISNNNSIHARHVVEIKDLKEHQRRWILKSWVVDDLNQHKQYFIDDLINVSDE